MRTTFARSSSSVITSAIGSGTTHRVPYDRAQIERLTHHLEWLPRCAKIANGAKHAQIQKGRISEESGAILLENGDRLSLEQGGALLHGGVFFVVVEGAAWPAFPAATACLKEWRQVLKSIGLLQPVENSGGGT